MDERTLRVLEFFKIRDRLAGLTVTAVGMELASALQPSSDAETVRRSLRETAEATALLADGEVPLRGTVDIRELLHRARVGSVLDPQEFLSLRDTLVTIRQCKGFVYARRDRASLLAEATRGMGTFDELEQTIRRTIADDGSIPDGASGELARIRRDQRTVQGRIREKLDDLLRGPYARMMQEQLVTTRGDRYVVPVKQEHKNQFPGVLHDQSASGATVFMEPLATLQLGNQLRELEIAEREEISRLLRDLAGRVAAVADEIGWAYDALGHIDFAVAKARLADVMQATLPRLRTDGALKLLRARHPLLTGEASPEPGRGVVPIDAWLGEEFTTLVITGPNTGGKTVTLKTIGLLTLMALAGLYVPADEGSEIAVFPQVFADIGDEQSIEQSLSTFSSHMGAIVGILARLATSASPSPLGGEGGARPEPEQSEWFGVRGTGALVLLDEIGAGTDPTEGVALARAIIEHLHARGIRTVVTTHYNELKALAYTHAGIQNASVEFDPETLRPTFRLLIGVPGRSNALTIASRLGLEDPIVEQARSYVGPERVAIDRILSDIEADRRAYEYELSEAARLRQEAEGLRARTEQELADLRADRKKILSRLREEAEALLIRTRHEAESIIAALKASSGKEAVQEARAKLRELTRELEERVQPEASEPGEVLTDVRPGQDVYVVPLRRPGTVLTPPDARGEIEVAAGAMRVRLQMSALRALTSTPTTAGRTPRRPAEVKVPPPVPISITIRGQTVDEAIPKLDEYLDDAFMGGLERVTIVHGKGTGALRKAVHEFLKTHPHVKRFRLGERGKGDAGATIVELDVL